MADFSFNDGAANPFTAGLMAMLAGTNPGLIANAAAANGIQPPGSSMINGVDNNTSPLGMYLTPSASDPNSAAAPGASPTGAPAAMTNPWAMMSGLKAPAPNQPLMSGGVSGAQKAPDMNMAAQNSQSTALQQLIATLIASHTAGAGASPVGAVGSLGSVLRG